MHLFTLSPKQAVILLPFLLSLPLNAFVSGFERRAGTPLCCIGSCPDDDNGNEAPTLDGPISDKSAGIGVEFETGELRFLPNGACNKSDIDKSKGTLVNNRQGRNWMLTTDTTLSDLGFLTAEYILNGKDIKIRSGDAAKAASAVTNDITSWDPSADIIDDVTVQNSKCNPWEIAAPEHVGKADQIGWAPQVTAPLPLEAISDLFSKAVSNKHSDLLPSISPGRNMIWVNKDFFQSNPNTISADSVKDDILGFFSLILSYAKNARDEEEDQSPKELTSIMPRTEFTTIFAQVKSKVPLNPNTLYELVKVLACYKNNASDVGVDLDSEYCTGTVTAPVPKAKMDGQTFTVTPTGGETQSLKVQDWIQSIQDGISPDKLSRLDQAIDSSIGGLGNALENVFNSNPSRAVPLFEFRRLRGVIAGDMEGLVTRAEDAIVAYHNVNVNPPRFIKRRTDGKYAHIKRQACPSAIPATTTLTLPPPPPPPTPSPPSAGPDADSCDVSYRFVLDSFEISGKNFDASKFGTDGSGLKTQIKGCGALTKWKFQMTPSSPIYQWHASGQLPIGVKNCVGNAVISAGGSSKGNCHGAG